MFRLSAILLLGLLLAVMPVGFPANPVSSENLKSDQRDKEAPFVLELVETLGV